MAANTLTTTTKIADVIVPEVFTPYVIEKTAEKSKLLTSGIAVASNKLNQLITGGGVTIQMPFWKDLQGDDEVLSDQRALTPGKINSGKDIAALLLRGKAWGANDLSGALAGDDPMNAIADRVSDYWARREQKILLSVLKGVFAAASMANHILDRSTVGISPDVVLDGKQLLGDSADQLQSLFLHSAVYTQLQKLNVIKYVDGPVGPSGSPIQIPTYLGYNLVIDDGAPVEQKYKKTSDVALVSGKNYYTYNSSTGVYTLVASPDVSDIGDYYEEDYKEYTTYLFARGVVARAAGVPVSQVPTETDRDSLAGEDILINRIAQIIHIYGIKWKGQPADSSNPTPANSDLEIGTNWERVYEDKNIGIVAIKHRLVDPS